jgi:hypothetical protein
VSEGSFSLIEQIAYAYLRFLFSFFSFFLKWFYIEGAIYKSDRLWYKVLTETYIGLKMTTKSNNRYNLPEAARAPRVAAMKFLPENKL